MARPKGKSMKTKKMIEKELVEASKVSMNALQNDQMKLFVYHEGYRAALRWVLEKPSDIEPIVNRQLINEKRELGERRREKGKELLGEIWKAIRSPQQSKSIENKAPQHQ